MLRKLIVTTVLGFMLLSASSFAQSSCGSFLPWNSSKVYWANDQTEYLGNTYKAKWWTQNQIPSNDPNGPWSNLGACVQNGTINPETLCNGVDTWSGAATYTAGNIVVYNGQKFKAKWWTQNETPNTSGSGAWELVSTCVYSSVTATASFTPFATIIGTPSAVQILTVSGSGLSSAVTIKVPSQFEISSDGINYSSTIALTSTAGVLASTTISVRYNPFSVGSHAGNLTVDALGLAQKTFPLSGTAQSAWVSKDPTTLYSNLAFSNVGIGTDNIPSTYRLAVNGKIIAKGLKIQFDNWADKVFDENYKLPDLNLLESYLKTNKHLPEFPAEKEVMNNGMALEDMNVLLLQKVEELTLLLIEQNKKTKALEQKMEVLVNKK